MLTNDEARQLLIDKGVPEETVLKVFPLEHTFIMDGDTHNAPTKITGCCEATGRQCKKCGGWMHYQPEHGGYFYRCEDCSSFEI